MAGRLEGRAVLITGAAQGLGRGAASYLAGEGANVVLADILAEVEEAGAEMKERYPGNRGFGVIADVTSGESVDEMVREVTARLGRLDVMVNNAGVNHPMMPVTETPDEVFDRVVGVNLRGTFNCCRAVGKVMRDQGSGSIVNVGSWYGKQGFANFAVYCSSKAAVIRFTESLALELAPRGVRVNSICPGNMATEMHWQALREEAEIRGITFEEVDRQVKESIPLGQQGTCDDIGAAIVYLATDGSYLTGQALNINGGVLFH